MRFLILLFLVLSVEVQAIDIFVDVAGKRKPISPFIYGKNNTLSDNPEKPLELSDWTRIKDSGVKILRESCGNNSTKYNWKRHLTSAPDWFNAVFNSDWDYEARQLQRYYPEAQGMWAFQLLGKAAKSADYNYDVWSYYVATGSKKWPPISSHQNLTGGGVPNPAEGATKALVEGDIDLYLEDWPPEATVELLDHWFGSNGIGLNRDKIRYWCMDNEVEIWSGTHDDVQPSPIADEFLQSYFKVAKLARAKYPDIKLLAPSACNEWFWYASWGNTRPKVWLEYFIKRVAEEQQASDMRLLDILDIHFYPGTEKTNELVQMHRVYFDTTYVFPEANAVKMVNGGWDNSINKEYIFERCRVWLDKYFGPGHGITFGVTETGIKSNNPNVTAVWYASTIGEFSKYDVEVFTPWSWKVGMWEVLHLFGRYHQKIHVASTSSLETLVSAYSANSIDGRLLSIILVNRDIWRYQKVNVTLDHFRINDGVYNALVLNKLPEEETYHSHADNALKPITVDVKDGKFEMNLPCLSVTAVQLVGQALDSTGKVVTPPDFKLGNYPNPFRNGTNVYYQIPHDSDVKLSVYDVLGREIQRIETKNVSAGRHTHELNSSVWPAGVYFLQITAGSHRKIHKILHIQ